LGDFLFRDLLWKIQFAQFFESLLIAVEDLYWTWWKLSWDAFWMIFSQQHLVTLVGNNLSFQFWH
jgi:hypothetical protein